MSESENESVKQYTLEEVKEHDKPDDVWIIINDKVYDLTKFLEEHPGGSEVLIEVAGREATAEFVDIGHSSDAIEQMKDFCIGEIVESERKSKPKAEGANYCKAMLFGSAIAIVGTILLLASYKMKKNL